MSALPTQHTRPQRSHPEAGLVAVWDPRRWVRPAPVSFIPSLQLSLFPCPSLPMPSVHTRNSRVLPSKVLTRMFPAKFPCLRELQCNGWMCLQRLRVIPPVLELVLAFVLCQDPVVLGSKVTTEVLSVTQHQLEVFSSHACDVRLH